MSDAATASHVATPGEPAVVVDDTILESHFDDLQQQHDSALLGMWGFLATEVMFFGGLLTAYAVYRSLHPEAFARASEHLSVALGGINTVVLLTSSLTMAMAVNAAQERKRVRLVQMIGLTILLGTVFLGIKGYEWYREYGEHLVPGFNYRPHGSAAERYDEMFFVLYFFMTGLHGLHMIVGIAILGIMAALAWRGWFSGGGGVQVEAMGLYWHFVDIVWVFLYPLLYLIDVAR